MEKQVTEEEANRLMQINTEMTRCIVKVNEMQKNVLTLIKNNTEDPFFIQLIDHCFEEEENLLNTHLQIVIEGAIIANKIN